MGIFSRIKDLIKKTETSELDKFDQGLEKTRKSLTSKLVSLSERHKKVNNDYFEELEELLIMADIGVNTSVNLIDKLKDRVKKERIENTEDLKEIIVDELFIVYVNNEIITNKLKFNQNGPTVMLFVGVNGVGKTTTIGKMGYKLTGEGKKVLMIAGDTFRAGATEQLEEWGKRVGCKVVVGEEEADPSSVMYKGIEEAIKDNIDVVLIDTAGRLQNKVNLMKELEKINKVIGKLIEGAPQETLLVIDATTGQNGVSQAKAFKEITDITGIILTKLDGTAKGGIVLAIKEEINIPVKYVGLGEKLEDLRDFDIEKYIYGLFKDFMED
jgi:fused signal recognition particle receptor